MLQTQQFVVCLGALLLLLYVGYLLLCSGRRSRDSQASLPPRRRRRSEAEFFDDPPPPPTATTTNAGATATAEPAATVDLQAAIDFSDVTVDPKDQRAFSDLQENSKQIQSVDERFQSCKRKVEEHKLKPGIFPNKKRRQLVEALVRRPFCGRRTRSWRTEFSDNLRGDVIPKNMNNNWSMMRLGRTDPTKDLHPGALGTMSSTTGLWNSVETVPENVFDGLEEQQF